MNEKTNGKIKEILPGSANTETRVILVNALYFKAEWQESFIDGATGFKKFYPLGKDNDYSIQVELMAHGGKNFVGRFRWSKRFNDCRDAGTPVEDTVSEKLMKI